MREHPTAPASLDTDAARQRFACARLGLSGDVSFQDLTSAAALDSTCELGAQLCDALDAAQAEAQRLRRALEKRGKELLVSMNASRDARAALESQIAARVAAASAIEQGAERLRGAGNHMAADDLEELL